MEKATRAELLELIVKLMNENTNLRLELNNMKMENAKFLVGINGLETRLN